MQDVLPEPGIEPGDARRAADDILSDAAYRVEESLLDRAGRYLNEVISRVFGQLTTGRAGSVVAIVLLAALLAVVAHLIRGRGAFGVDRLQRGATVTVAVQDREVDRSAAEWRDLALRAAAGGDYDSAIRARYRAVSADLAAAGLLDGAPGTTPRETARQLLGTDPRLGGPFTELTTMFERAWYGPVAATEADDALAADLEHVVTRALSDGGRVGDGDLVGAAR